ncbi:putative disease resistance protein RGA3 [Coffea arabica]|uniref:Disease resistance protein RGA3 n=1 Tax=Coffea arabica TaxID=13443 RepID=A0ABM4X775_COFAR
MNDGPYILGRLADDECWSILKEKAIRGEGVPKELEALKEKILRRCDGLPLAASLIEAKKCFACCSIFPQDTELEQDLLTELWMAEGFLQPGHQNGSVMEEIGSDYLRILLQASLLEKVEEEERTYYKMHDLVHDFAKSILNPKSSNQYRYLALYSSEAKAKNITEKIPTSLRTLFLENGISDNMLSKMEYLHVLKLAGPDVNVLPNSIGSLLHLRFLDISDSGITTLPESLCKLYNLQTLRINGEKLHEGLPEGTSNLISLRHLHYYHSDAELQMPIKLGRLTSLQTLEFFNIGEEKGCGVEELGTLKDLKGSLGSGDRESDNGDGAVLEGLQPHYYLQMSEIQDFMGYQFPQWFMNLSKLVSLELKGCNRCRELPAGLGELPFLQLLSLSKLENLTCIGLSFYGIFDKQDGRGSTSECKFFPALKSLTLEDMVNLVEWRDPDEVRSTTDEDVAAFPVLC